MSVTETANIVRAAGCPGTVARLLGCSKRTARRYRDGSTLPADALLRLVARSAAARAVLLAALGLDDAIALSRLAEIEAAIAAARMRRAARTKRRWTNDEEPPHALAPGAAACPSLDRPDAAAGTLHAAGGGQGRPLGGPRQAVA